METEKNSSKHSNSLELVTVEGVWSKEIRLFKTIKKYICYFCEDPRNKDRVDYLNYFSG
jgi:hypothetical protein